MKPHVLITSSSFLDTPGPHHQLLQELGWSVEAQRGPLQEKELLSLMGGFDAVICGDDRYTEKVLRRALPRLKVLSKYGVGLDSIDLEAAERLGIPVTNCPGVNQTTVAEHFFGLLLALYRRLPEENALVHAGHWKRFTGREIRDKTLGILGLGRTGREIARRARAFAMKIAAHDPAADREFAEKYGISLHSTPEEVIEQAEILSLALPLTPETRFLMDSRRLELLPPEAVIINTARGAMVDAEALCRALDRGDLYGYAADVLDPEPPPPDHCLLGRANVILTPHIGSRTRESVARQGIMALENAARYLNVRITGGEA